MQHQRFSEAICHFYRKTSQDWEPVVSSKLETGNVICMVTPNGIPLSDHEGFISFKVVETYPVLGLEPLE